MSLFVGRRPVDRVSRLAKVVLRTAVDRPWIRRLVRPPRWGNLRRLRPFSARYGFDRGTPIDRHYLYSFFGRRASDIRGRVLEVCNPEFSGRFGHEVTSIDLVDIDPRNDSATIIADLADADCLPAGAFDCVILPQTLQYVTNLERALANVWRSLAAGGTLLISVPGISKVDHHLRDIDRWRVLPAGLTAMLVASCPAAIVEIEAFGNVLSASAFLLGLAAEELRPEELMSNDYDFPILCCARVRKESV